MKKKIQIVLVHGGCHGAWCWYKVKPSLEAAGHRVAAVDLTASGVNMNRVEEIRTLQDFARPLLQLLESLGPDERVVLVAHSMAGPSVALASDIFPLKISVSVFLTSFMPDITHPPSYVVEKILNPVTQEEWLDNKFMTYGTSDHPLTSLLLGPVYLAKNMYQLSPVEDLELAKTLVRTAPYVSSNLTGKRSLTKEGYGSVARVYIICGEDKAIPEEGQRWMIENFPVDEVMEIRDADHMPMFSTPRQVCELLSKIADKYA
ncbi:PREDICTED: methylesterase 9-like [Tarenaya hassleriana]|uniref:methylesterase 9-like n=1 Tax=Tarenaya hassleriana TaxID=28532 RepID=UPI00053C0B61|nr:PREDICTED: methylesterase 9-like [Tarenaya hassleriana]